MIEIISDLRVTAYVTRRTGIVLERDHTALGIVRDGAVIGGVVFNNYTGIDVHMTVAGEAKAFTRIFYHRVRDYVFSELGCLRISITTQQQNIVDLAIRLGAQTEGRKRNHFGTGQDGIMLGILKDDWKV